MHPQAQRNFYKLLNELADNGTQVFLTTHSPHFLNVGSFNEIFLARKNAQRGTYINCACVEDFISDLKLRTGISSDQESMLLQYRNAYEHTGDTQKANEAFFSKAVILVEGESESLVLPYLFDIVKFDYIGKGITIVRCGGKNDIDRFYRLYSEFGIPCYVIFDGDSHHTGTSEEESTKKKNRALLRLLGHEETDLPDGSVNNNFIGFEQTFDQSLCFSTSQKGLKLYKTVREKIKTIEQVPSWVFDLVGHLDELTKTVTITKLLKEKETQQQQVK